VHAHAYVIFWLHHFYVILQLAGLGYLIGGSIIVADPPARWFLIPFGLLGPVHATGKLNLWRHFSKSAVVFDSIKTHIVGGINKFILKLDIRRLRHVPVILLQQNDLPVPLERRLSGPESRSGSLGVDTTPLPMPGIESLFLSFPAGFLFIVVTT
jgi:hypothetical protein